MYRNLSLWNQLSIVFGCALWLMIALLRLSGLITLNGPELLLLLAFFAITPLVLRLVVPTTGCKMPFEIDQVAMLLQPFAAFSGSASLLIAPGPLAALVAGIWLAFTGLIALLGLAMLFRRNRIDIGDVCLAFGLIYLPIGGAWFVMARLGIKFLIFGNHTIWLTAAHFHYIPLAALTLTGLTGRVLKENQGRLSWKIYRIVAVGMIVYPLLVAVGITIDQLIDNGLIETIAALLLAINVLLLSALNLRFIVPQLAPLLSKGLLAISNSALLLTMSFAGAYALGNATGAWTITISQMIAVHGWINALVFGFCGLVAWNIKQSQQE